MKRNTLQHLIRKGGWLWSTLILIGTLWASTALAVPLPGGTLDPLTIPKYVQPLVIPPVMPTATVQPTVLDAAGNPVAVPAAKYNIAMRQFQQQILPGGAWNLVNGRTDGFPATPIWSYGPAEIDPVAVAAAISPLPLNANNDLGLPAFPTGYFNYPAFTLEETSNVANSVRWINDLRDPNNDNAYRPHLLTGTVDQTLHWANPTNAGCTNTLQSPQTDCATTDPAPYTGPVPIVTHVHGAHVNAESDGYPEAWWLPAATDIPAGFATEGTLYTQNINGLAQTAGTPNDALNDIDPVPGAAFYSYENTQPATTIWYHDHALGMTRLNVYAGPAGFYLIRGGVNDGGMDVLKGGPAVLPGPAPIAGEDPNFVSADRSKLREIPIVIQDRSFNADGSLFYPTGRAFFDGFTGPYVGTGDSDINPIWNPEAFFNTMVVNGTTWPKLDVAPAKYRFRLLNGSNSRFINLAMFTVDPLTGATTPVELPFYQIGGDQGFLPTPVEIRTGFITPVNTNAVAQIGVEIAAVTAGINKEIIAVTAALNKDIAKLQAKLAATTKPKKIAKLQQKIAKLQTKLTNKVAKKNLKLAAKIAKLQAKAAAKAVKKLLPAPDPMQALLMAPAERADTIVDFSGLPAGTIVRMINTAPDAPFGGFPDIPADPQTSGQVMQFVVNQPTLASDALTTSAFALVPNAEVYDPAAPNAQTGATTTVVATPRVLSLNEEESFQVCVNITPAGTIGTTRLTFATHNPNIVADCAAAGLVPQAPKAALLGLIKPDATGALAGVPLLWKDPLTENPALDSTEYWDFYNLTVDGHPIHMHLVRYKIIHRQVFDPLSPTFAALGPIIPALPTEAGMKDTVLSYPGEVTRVQATFNMPGLYVWHCHIVEHEDNEMMRPFFVGTKPAGFPVP